MQTVTSIRLSELTAEVHKTLSNVFANRFFWVIGEVTSYNYYAQKGHHYFELVEKSSKGTEILAKMQAAAWAAGNNSIRNFERITGQKFKNDIQVLVKVSVDFHSTHGLKLTLHDIDINFTIGALEQQKQETLQRLLTECADFVSKAGDRYITSNNKLGLPAVIQKIAVITSSQSAGLNDFVHTIESNSFGYQFFMKNYYTVVQGEAKAELFYNKLLEVYNSGINYDVVVIIRGGGAQTDFLIFDQFILGKIVAKFPIPIITGIGHQKNETIVDLMANTATKTPTKSAEFILAHNRQFEEKILSFQKVIIIKSQQLFSKHKDQLMQNNQIIVNNTKQILFHKKSSLLSIASEVASRPRMLVSNKVNDLANIISNLRTFKSQFLKNQKGYLNHYVSITKAMAPDNILKKGFAIIKVDNKITSNPDKVIVGKDISVILSKTTIRATVKSKNEYDGADFNV